MKHLNDEALQTYLDGRNSGNRQQVETHLLACRQCQRALGVYRQVYSALSSEPLAALSPAFADTMMQKITNESEKFSQRLEWLLCGISATLGLVMAVYLFATGLTGDQLLDFSRYFQGLFSFAKSTHILSSQNISLLLLASAVLTVLHFLDKYLFWRKFKKAV